MNRGLANLTLPHFPRSLIATVITMLIAVTLGGGDARAQTGAPNHDPTELLKKYLTLDLHGVRLEPHSQEALQPYVNWKEEPPWGQVVVVTSYEILDDMKRWEIRGNLDVIIPVQFKVLGSVYLESASFLEERRTEELRFHIKMVSGLWRIIEPIAPPHVGQKRMVNYVRQALLEEHEPSQAERLAVLRDALKKAR